LKIKKNYFTVLASALFDRDVRLINSSSWLGNFDTFQRR